ncbi:MAG: FliA/WhiG family RNA polymerase sigma factor [Planctomycetota bacterium]
MSEAPEAQKILDRADRDQLILEHVPLLHHIVGRMSWDQPGRVEREDLLGFGMLGLIAAADSWEPERGLKFSTYAYPRIRGSILDELRRLDFLPRGRREKVRSVDRAVAKLEQERGVPPTPDEIASELGIEESEVDEILHSARLAGTVSIEQGPSEDLSGLLRDPSSDDPEGTAEWREMKDMLVRAIAALPEQEKTVVTLYYGEELLLRDIGEVMGVTESRVSQIHSRALYLLNRGLKLEGGSR